MRRTGGVGALDNKVKRGAEGVSVMKQEMRFSQSKLSAQSATRVTLGSECLPVSASEDPGPASYLFQRDKQDGRGKDEQMATCGFLWAQREQRPFRNSIHCSGHMREGCLGNF